MCPLLEKKKEFTCIYRTLAKGGPWPVHLILIGPRLGDGLIFEVSVSRFYAWAHNFYMGMQIGSKLKI